MERIILELDAANLVRALNFTDFDSSDVEVLSEECCNMLLSFFSQTRVVCCGRDCNRAADCLATFGAGLSKLWLDQPPAIWRRYGQLRFFKLSLPKLVSNHELYELCVT